MVLLDSPHSFIQNYYCYHCSFFMYFFSFDQGETLSPKILSHKWMCIMFSLKTILEVLQLQIKLVKSSLPHLSIKKKTKLKFARHYWRKIKKIYLHDFLPFFLTFIDFSFNWYKCWRLLFRYCWVLYLEIFYFIIKY